MPGSETHRLTGTKARNIRRPSFLSTLRYRSKFRAGEESHRCARAKTPATTVCSSLPLRLGSHCHHPWCGSGRIRTVRRVHHQIFPAPLQYLYRSGPPLAISHGFQAYLGGNDCGGFPGGHRYNVLPSEHATLIAQMDSAWCAPGAAGTNRAAYHRRLSKPAPEKPPVLRRSRLHPGWQRLRTAIHRATGFLFRPNDRGFWRPAENDISTFPVTCRAPSESNWHVHT